eukprot:8382557-Pyramimonas_sp.AAC.1
MSLAETACARQVGVDDVAEVVWRLPMAALKRVTYEELCKESFTGPILYKWLHIFKEACDVVYAIQHEKDRLAKEEADRLEAERLAEEEAARIAAEEAEDEDEEDEDD